MKKKTVKRKHIDPDDYLAGKSDSDTVVTIYTEIDEKHSSILEKQTRPQEVVNKILAFHQGIFHLAITHFQLGQKKEVLSLLERYIAINASDPTTNYFHAAINFQRFNFVQAWKYLQKAELIIFSHNHHPCALKKQREELQRFCPQPH